MTLCLLVCLRLYSMSQCVSDCAPCLSVCPTVRVSMCLRLYSLSHCVSDCAPYLRFSPSVRVSDCTLCLSISLTVLCLSMFLLLSVSQFFSDCTPCLMCLSLYSKSLSVFPTVTHVSYVIGCPHRLDVSPTVLRVSMCI